MRRARDDEFDALMALRYAVFCDEQGVPHEEERDAHDDTALHLVAVDGERVVGTCRLVEDGDRWRLGRMAVDAAWRGRGVGAALLRAGHEEAVGAGGGEIHLAAQMSARDFYRRYGYRAYGDLFDDAGIPHVMMSRVVGEGVT